MATLKDIVLSVSKILGGVREGVATAGTTTSLTDTTRRIEPAETYDEGFLVMLSGANDGRLLKIKSYAEGIFTFYDTLTTTIAAGNRYAVVPPDFKLEDIVSAINTALSDFGMYLQHNEDLDTDSQLQTYTLPDGVSDVRRFEVAQQSDSPYSYKEQYYWEENNGYIYFRPGKEPSTSGSPIRLWYIGEHAELVDYDDELSTEIDERWLKWASVVNAYRSYYSIFGDNDPNRVQLMNEAVQNEGMERIRANGRVRRSFDRTPRLAAY